MFVSDLSSDVEVGVLAGGGDGGGPHLPPGRGEPGRTVQLHRHQQHPPLLQPHQAPPHHRD